MGAAAADLQCCGIIKRRGTRGVRWLATVPSADATPPCDAQIYYPPELDQPLPPPCDAQTYYDPLELCQLLLGNWEEAWAYDTCPVSPVSRPVDSLQKRCHFAAKKKLKKKLGREREELDPSPSLLRLLSSCWCHADLGSELWCQNLFYGAQFPYPNHPPLWGRKSQGRRSIYLIHRWNTKLTWEWKCRCCQDRKRRRGWQVEYHVEQKKKRRG